jgi:hypothetical protein
MGMDAGGSSDLPLWLRLALWSCAALVVVGVGADVAYGLRGVTVYKDVLGPDFATFWGAGRLVDEGRSAVVFDPHAFDAWQRQTFGPSRGFAFWSYPPPALLIFAPFGQLPFLGAYALFMALSFGLLLWVARGWLGSWRRAWLVGLSPASAATLIVGQVSFLASGALLGGFMLMERRPRLAGAVLGSLILKPQLAILLPVAMLAERRWTVAAGAACSAVATCAASLIFQGPGLWEAFVTQSLATQAAMLTGGTGFFQIYMPTALMSARLIGAPMWLGWAAQGLCAAAGVAIVWRTFRRPGDVVPKGAVLIIATALASPQCFHYDLVAYSAAILLLLAASPSPAGAAIALAGWLLPALVVGFGVLRTPLSPVITLAVAVWAMESLGRGRSGRTRSAGGPPAAGVSPASC